jgi:outer membrane protein assembly factor BamB
VLARYCVFLLLLPPLAAAEDWPQFLGPRSNATSAETGLLDKWPTNGPPLVWERTVGSGYSAPSVRSGALAVHHRIKDEEVVEALDAANGQPRWRYAYRSDFIDPYGYNNGPRCTPLLTSNRCYTFGAEGKLVCLEFQSGKLIWQRDTGKDWDVPPAFFGVGSTPILEGNLLIVMIGGQPNSGMVALDAATGKTVWESVGEKNWHGLPKKDWRGEPPVDWKAEDKQASYSSPIAATIHGKRHVFCLMRQGLVSLDPLSGAVNFSRWFRTPVPESVNASTPFIVDDMVLISAAYYRIGSGLLRVKPDGKSYDELWRSTALELHWMTPIYHDGVLYAFSGRNEPDARFRCVEFKTGKILWERNEQWVQHSVSQPPVFGRGSLLLADNKLIALGEGGLLGMFKLNSKQCEEICRFQPPQLHYPCWAGPILSGKRMYVRSENRLVCYNLAR